MLRTRVLLSDLLGLSRLVLDGAQTITNVVEGVHAAVLAPLNPFGTLGLAGMGGIPGLVYRSIYAGYGVAGAGVQVALNSVTPATLARPDSTPERERMLAILNGVWGDHLEASGNPLAIPMSLKLAGVPLRVDARPIQPALGAPGRRLLVLVHGLCMNDLGWRQGGHDQGDHDHGDHDHGDHDHGDHDHGDHDHGAELARELGFTPLYLHYNSGLHVSTNGKRLAAMLEHVVEGWPGPVEELTIVGYSMGGLVARSAVYYGLAGNHKWPERLHRLVFLGTPHHGSRLERAGSRADALLNATRYSAPFRRLGTTRSAGITDLRHGSVIDEDWQGRDRFGHHDDTRCPAPLPQGVACYTIGATLGSRAGDVRSRVLGDGIVPLDSALGIHKNAEHCLGFPEANQWVGYGMSHMDLLRRPEVFATMRDWLAA